MYLATSLCCHLGHFPACFRLNDCYAGKKKKLEEEVCSGEYITYHYIWSNYILLSTGGNFGHVAALTPPQSAMSQQGPVPPSSTKTSVA